MPSPFPGMNPYLENPTSWRDFHHSFLVRLREALVKRLKPLGYWVRVDVEVYLREQWSEFEVLLGIPDTAIGTLDRHVEDSGSTMTLSVPVRSMLTDDVPEEKVTFLELVDIKNRSVVAVIELLSPSNKNYGKDRAKYLYKRKMILESSVHLIELDFLRAGPRMKCQAPPACDYLVMVSRAEQRPEIDLWPIRLREPLPTIGIPLRGSDAISINLQNVLNDLYDASDYELDCYASPLKPPLRPDDAAWADDCLRAAGITPPEAV